MTDQLFIYTQRGLGFEYRVLIWMGDLQVASPAPHPVGHATSPIFPEVRMYCNGTFYIKLILCIKIYLQHHNG